MSAFYPLVFPPFLRPYYSELARSTKIMKWWILRTHYPEIASNLKKLKKASIDDAAVPISNDENSILSSGGLVLVYQKYQDRVHKMYRHFGRASWTRRKIKTIGPELGRLIRQLENGN